MNNFVLNNVRAYWTAQVFDPEAREDGEKPKYSISVIIGKDHEQLSEFRKYIALAAKERFSSTAGLSSPLNDADLNKDTTLHPQLKGCYTLRASTQYPFPVVDLYGDPVAKEDNKLVPGSYVNLEVGAFTYDRMGRKGVGVRPLAVQFIKNDASIGQAARHLPFKFLRKPTAEGANVYDSDTPDLPKSSFDELDDDIPF